MERVQYISSTKDTINEVLNVLQSPKTMLQLNLLGHWSITNYWST